MTHRGTVPDAGNRNQEADGRRRQLRNLLLSAADAARQTRRVASIAGRIGRPLGRAIRDRISTLLIAV